MGGNVGKWGVGEWHVGALGVRVGCVGGCGWVVCGWWVSVLVWVLVGVSGCKCEWVECGWR